LARKTTEKLAGNGALFIDGRQVATVVYEIEVFREFRPVTGRQLDDADSYITGTIWSSGDTDLAPFVRRRLILKLHDKADRAWECRLEDPIPVANGVAYPLNNAGTRGLCPASELFGEERERRN